VRVCVFPVVWASVTITRASHTRRHDIIWHPHPDRPGERQDRHRSPYPNAYDSPPITHVCIILAAVTLTRACACLCACVCVCVQIDPADEAVRGCLVLNNGELMWPPPPPPQKAAPAAAAAAAPKVATIEAKPVDYEAVSAPLTAFNCSAIKYNACCGRKGQAKMAIMGLNSISGLILRPS
jgi:hypothetical protein